MIYLMGPQYQDYEACWQHEYHAHQRGQSVGQEEQRGALEEGEVTTAEPLERNRRLEVNQEFRKSWKEVKG